LEGKAVARWGGFISGHPLLFLTAEVGILRRITQASFAPEFYVFSVEDGGDGCVMCRTSDGSLKINPKVCACSPVSMKKKYYLCSLINCA